MLVKQRKAPTWSTKKRLKLKEKRRQIKAAGAETKTRQTRRLENTQIEETM